MPTTAPSFDPFWMFRLPLSGNVDQRITAPWFSPSLTVNYAGDARIEDRVVTEVASYGRQLGWVTEIVLALAAGHAPPEATLHRLHDAADRIEEIKHRVRQSALDEATSALDRLASEQPATYRQFLRARLDAPEAGQPNSGA